MGSSDRYQTWGRGEGDKHMTFTCVFVDWRFLSVMGIDIVEGRNFRQTDGDVYIFSESAKKKYPWLAVDKPIIHHLACGRQPAAHRLRGAQQ